MTRAEAIKSAHESLDALFATVPGPSNDQLFRLALANLLDAIYAVRAVPTVDGE